MVRRWIHGRRRCCFLGCGGGGQPIHGGRRICRGSSGTINIIVVIIIVIVIGCRRTTGGEAATWFLWFGITGTKHAQTRFSGVIFGYHGWYQFQRQLVTTRIVVVVVVVVVNGP